MTRPVTMDGAASEVHSCTVVAFRYHVDSRARRAKLGYRIASISPLRVISELAGSSSSRRKTTGAGDSTRTCAASASSVSEGRPLTNQSRPTTGTTIEYPRKSRAARQRP